MFEGGGHISQCRTKGHVPMETDVETLTDAGKDVPDV